MRGCLAAVVLAACGGSTAGLLPDGGTGQAGDQVFDVHDGALVMKTGTCAHPETHDVAVLVRDGYWLESGSQTKIPSNNYVEAHMFERPEWPGATLERLVTIHDDGTVTGTLRFFTYTCEGTYTTTGKRR
jgi:hypothetical protein